MSCSYLKEHLLSLQWKSSSDILVIVFLLDSRNRTRPLGEAADRHARVRILEQRVELPLSRYGRAGGLRAAARGHDSGGARRRRPEAGGHDEREAPPRKLSPDR